MGRGRRTRSYRRGALVRKLGPAKQIRNFNHYYDSIVGQTEFTILSQVDGKYGVQLVGDYCKYDNFSINDVLDWNIRNLRACQWRPVACQVLLRPVSCTKVWYARDGDGKITGSPLGNPVECKTFRIRSAPLHVNIPNTDLITSDEGVFERMCKVKTHPVGKWSSFYAWKVARHMLSGKYLPVGQMPKNNTASDWDLILGKGNTSVGHFADLYSNTLDHDVGAKWVCIDKISDGNIPDPDTAGPGLAICCVSSLYIERKVIFKCEFFGQRTQSKAPRVYEDKEKLCVVCEDSCIHETPME